MGRTIFKYACSICGKKCSYNSGESLERRKTRKFCSKICLYKSKEAKNSWFKVGHNTSLSNNGNWKGGRHIDKKGYIKINLGKSLQFEHRLVMERHIGRPLKKNESVHHIDQDKHNNSINNLVLFPSESAHQKYHDFISSLGRED